MMLKLERRIVVAMPGQDGDGTTVRTPVFRQRARRLLARALGQGEDASEAGLDREVARGPDVRPAFREQQVDLGGPAADALDPDKLLDRFLVVSGQALEIELAGRYELAERARVTLLLARQAARAQRIEVGRQQGFG